MVALTREERIRRVLEHHNQGIGTREISKLLHMSFTDIAKILKDADKEKESEQQQRRQEFLSSKAYTLFSEGKSPVQVAIALNIRESEVARFYVEYWKLRQLYSLYKTYEEIKDDIGYFVRLYTLAKVARMDTPSVIRVLEIANNDLPLVEHKCERLKKEVDDLEANKHNSARLLQEISDQIATMRKTLDQYQLSCKEERLELTKIQLQKVRLEGLVDNFQNNDEGYVKIRNTAEEKVVSILSDKKTLLKLALLSLIESMRKDPDRYISLIYHNKTSSNADYNSQNYDSASYGQQQYPVQAYTGMLIEEAERLYNKLTKELVDEIITDYSSTISSSLPLLQTPFDEKEQQQPKPLTQRLPAAEERNQPTYME